jgi:low affinity Fe/Cu permease
MRAKLDAQLRAVAKARGEFIGIEHLSETDVEKIRPVLEKEVGHRRPGSKAHASETLDKLLRRT